ncbi:hypothetical protein RCG19_03435 [Neobacillus sp. OS1-2]|uniref:hypothetical protein n=1 Tax=Neobacillus sp. OS1-2 TaxID=3070680 RepID=UPI0027E06A3D|nr:hypothetical protein [Neobacillus sp. OS1-2]WML40757.1 hypothetical protein RCG19_03435 [Neobacillus sp. OS1-2]
MLEVTTQGRGKKATYTFMIPDGFWRLILIPSMSFREWGAEYLNILIEGKGVHKAEGGILVKFSSEIMKELAEKYKQDYESVKSTCRRIRDVLKENGYISMDDPSVAKSHRVKSKKTGEWMTGTYALMKDAEARAEWKNFFDIKLAHYQLIMPDAKTVPNYLIAAEASRIYRSDMARWLDVAYYRVAKRTYVSDNMTADINFAKFTFLETLDMGIVRNELERRQEQYKRMMAERMEREKRRKELEKSQIPSLKERKALQAQITQAVQTTYRRTRGMTPEEQESWDKMIEMTVGSIATEVDEEE